MLVEFQGFEQLNVLFLSFYSFVSNDLSLLLLESSFSWSSCAFS